jgi:hypothetical protein
LSHVEFWGIVTIGVYADLNLPTLGKKMRKRKLPKQRAAMKDERKHLTVLEVEKLLAAIKGAWHEAHERVASGTHASCTCRAELDGPTWSVVGQSAFQVLEIKRPPAKPEVLGT